ncbi:MAG: hypothetical protein QHH24_04130 [Candidatus Bathyarchaeota archaeon]|jgi:hypothetical protein|nr:hypothetical protein [Candidatus Bathyarchaeota archaeon]
MTCYLKHLKETLRKAGIELTSENRQEIDRTIHRIAGVNYKNCPSTWKEVKKQIAENEEAFIAKLKAEWSRQKH